MNDFSFSVGPTMTLPDSPASVAGQYSYWKKMLYRVISMLKKCYAKWMEIGVPDLKAYFDYILLIGLNSLPSIVKSDVYHYSPIASRLTRDRFRKI